MVDRDTGLIDSADAVLALFKIDEPTRDQHVGALLVGAALLKLCKL